MLSLVGGLFGLSLVGGSFVLLSLVGGLVCLLSLVEGSFCLLSLVAGLVGLLSFVGDLFPASLPLTTLSFAVAAVFSVSADLLRDELVIPIARRRGQYRGFRGRGREGDRGQGVGKGSRDKETGDRGSQLHPAQNTAVQDVLLVKAGISAARRFLGKTPPKHAAKPRDCPCRPQAHQRVGVRLRVRVRSGVGLVWLGPLARSKLTTHVLHKVLCRVKLHIPHAVKGQGIKGRGEGSGKRGEGSGKRGQGTRGQGSEGTGQEALARGYGTRGQGKGCAGQGTGDRRQGSRSRDLRAGGRGQETRARGGRVGGAGRVQWKEEMPL